mgnify:CR=1 FL=1
MKRSLSAVVGLVFCAGVWGAAIALGGEPEQPAWKPLMDGKTLAGWHKVGDGTWTVEDGAFVGRAHKEKLYGLLFSDATFKDFTVRFKFKCLTGDSGFYIRTVLKRPTRRMGSRSRSARPAPAPAESTRATAAAGWKSPSQAKTRSSSSPTTGTR